MRSPNPLVATLAPIWADPKHVLVDPNRIQHVGKSLSQGSFEVPCWRERVFPQDDLVFVEFIGVGNAINFAFTDFETKQTFCVEYAGVEWSGAFAMWACLARALDEGQPVLDPRYLRQLDHQQASRLFRGVNHIPMLHERVRLLREVGDGMCERECPGFMNMIENAECGFFCPEGILHTLLRMFPSFRDVASHPKGRTVEFHKRAQLFGMMYQGRAQQSSRLPHLRDWRSIGPIADYAIPTALHNLGIMRYDPALEARIAAGCVIPRAGQEEVEIRAQAIKAQLELIDELKGAHGLDVAPLQLDHVLWQLGRLTQRPHHLTCTVAY